MYCAAYINRVWIYFKSFVTKSLLQHDELMSAEYIGNSQDSRIIKQFSKNEQKIWTDTSRTKIYR